MTAAPRPLGPRKTPVQARAHETRQRLLDAAARIFARHGYSAGTTNRIAEEAGASVGSLYQYFPNKDAILVALVRQHVADGAAAVAAVVAETDGLDVVARIPRVVDAVLAHHAGDPRLHQVLFEEAPRPVEVLDELHALDEATVDALAGLIRADDTLHVDDPVMVARIVVMTIESLVHRYVAGSARRPSDPAALERFRSELVGLLTSYLRTRT